MIFEKEQPNSLLFIDLPLQFAKFVNRISKKSDSTANSRQLSTKKLLFKKILFLKA